MIYFSFWVFGFFETVNGHLDFFGPDNPELEALTLSQPTPTPLLMNNPSLSRLFKKHLPLSFWGKVTAAEVLVVDITHWTHLIELLKLLIFDNFKVLSRVTKSNNKKFCLSLFVSLSILHNIKNSFIHYLLVIKLPKMTRARILLKMSLQK